MKPTHYHRAFGMFHAVAIVEKNGKVWTSDGILAKTANLKPLEELVGREVSIRNHKGIIKGFLSTNSDYCSGKYIGSGMCALPKPLQCYNTQVGVYWYYIDPNDNIPYYWNHFETLKIQK